MKIQVKNKLEIKQRIYGKWHIWFAWFPVKIKYKNNTFAWVWFQQVERKMKDWYCDFHHYRDWYHREIGSMNSGIKMDGKNLHYLLDPFLFFLAMLVTFILYITLL